jgi:predicted component of type VI protein secretion system
MLIKLLITEGLRKDDEFAIKGEIVIGRSSGDLTLRDPKVSNPHAKIFSPSPDVIEIEDLGSSNGTFVNKIKITKIILRQGDEITIGKTKLLVKELSSQTSPQPNVQISPDIDAGSWQEAIDAVLAVAEKTLDKKAPVIAQAQTFNPPLNLEFIQGIQTGTSLTYGFGPRLVGAHCTDGLLYDSEAPPVAFALFPNKDGSAQFKSKSSAVFLNGKSVKNQKLQDGDHISVGQTVIIVKGL